MSGTKKSKLVIVPTLITLVAFVILFRLGWWQMERAQQKSQELTQIGVREGEDILSLENFLSRGLKPQYARVTLDGQVLAGKVFYWDNRIKDGIVGYEVFGLLPTNAGTVSVNFGWLAATPNRDDLPEVALPSYLENRMAVLYQPKDNVFINETLPLDSDWPKRIQQPDLELMAQHAEQKLLPFIAVVDEDPEDMLSNNFTPVVMPPEKHIAYAIQWFGLALAVLIVFYFAVKKKITP